MRNRYDFSNVEFSQLKERLKDILADYEKIASSDPDKLRALIPADEVWRFFVEASVQENGRKLSQSEFFKETIPNKLFSMNPLNYTVKEYIENIEKISITERKEKSPFIKFLNERRWYLSDEECENFKLSDLLVMDRAWLPFEQNERNYFRALYTAFNEIFVAETLDVKNLHKISTQKVSGTLYENDEQSTGEFRTNQDASFAIHENTATEKGLFEFLERADACLSIELEISEAGWVVGSLRINRDSLFLIRKYAQELEARGAGKTVYEGKFLLSPLLTTHDQREFIAKIKSDTAIQEIIKQLGAAKNYEEVAKYLYNLMLHLPTNMRLKICSLQDSFDEQEVRDELNHKMASYLEEFKKIMEKAVQPIEKLYVIAAYIAECEDLHPFQDANCRTLCMLGVMCLCNKAGFPFPLLEDPNRFDLYDRESLVLELIKGMDNTLNLAAQPANKKSLFNVKTADVLQFLQSKPYLQDRANYFLETIAIEDGNRKMVRPMQKK